LGDVACFSFYGNKIITTGEGGMLTTKNSKIAATARMLRDHAFSRKRHFWHQYIGYNYRMSNLEASIGLAQTQRAAWLVQKRIDNAISYNYFLKGIEGITLPPAPGNARNVYWMYSILVQDNFRLSRDFLRKILAGQGIETRPFFIPLHLQPVYSAKSALGKFPVAEELCRKGINLPSSASLSRQEIKFIAGIIRGK